MKLKNVHAMLGLYAFLAAGFSAGADAPRESQPARVAIVSPEVYADGRVTFRLRAPAANSVAVSGDFGPRLKLERDAEGVWTATTRPLPRLSGHWWKGGIGQTLIASVAP